MDDDIESDLLYISKRINEYNNIIDLKNETSDLYIKNINILKRNDTININNNKLYHLNGNYPSKVINKLNNLTVNITSKINTIAPNFKKLTPSNRTGSFEENLNKFTNEIGLIPTTILEDIELNDQFNNPNISSLIKYNNFRRPSVDSISNLSQSLEKYCWYDQDIPPEKYYSSYRPTTPELVEKMKRQEMKHLSDSIENIAISHINKRAVSLISSFYGDSINWIDSIHSYTCEHINEKHYSQLEEILWVMIKKSSKLFGIAEFSYCAEYCYFNFLSTQSKLINIKFGCIYDPSFKSNIKNSLSYSTAHIPEWFAILQKKMHVRTDAEIHLIVKLFRSLGLRYFENLTVLCIFKLMKLAQVEIISNSKNLFSDGNSNVDSSKIYFLASGKCKVHDGEFNHSSFFVEEGSLIGIENLGDYNTDLNYTIDSSTAVFLVWKKKDFSACLRNEMRRSLTEKIEFFRFLNIFGNDNTGLIKFAVACNELLYTSNEAIFREGQESDYIYWVVKGELLMKAYSTNSLSFEIAIITQGNCIGDAGILNNIKRTTNLICRSDQCILYRMSKTDFLELCSSNFITAMRSNLDAKEIYNSNLVRHIESDVLVVGTIERTKKVINLLVELVSESPNYAAPLHTPVNKLIRANSVFVTNRPHLHATQKGEIKLELPLIEYNLDGLSLSLIEGTFERHALKESLKNSSGFNTTENSSRSSLLKFSPTIFIPNPKKNSQPLRPSIIRQHTLKAPINNCDSDEDEDDDLLSLAPFSSESTYTVANSKFNDANHYNNESIVKDDADSLKLTTNNLSYKHRLSIDEIRGIEEAASQLVAEDNTIQKSIPSLQSPNSNTASKITSPNSKIIFEDKPSNKRALSFAPNKYNLLIEAHHDIPHSKHASLPRSLPFSELNSPYLRIPIAILPSPNSTDGNLISVISNTSTPVKNNLLSPSFFGSQPAHPITPRLGLHSRIGKKDTLGNNELSLPHVKSSHKRSATSVISNTVDIGLFKSNALNSSKSNSTDKTPIYTFDFNMPLKEEDTTKQFKLESPKQITVLNNVRESPKKPSILIESPKNVAFKNNSISFENKQSNVKFNFDAPKEQINIDNNTLRNSIIQNTNSKELINKEPRLPLTARPAFKSGRSNQSVFIFNGMFPPKSDSLLKDIEAPPKVKIKEQIATPEVALIDEVCYSLRPKRNPLLETLGIKQKNNYEDKMLPDLSNYLGRAAQTWLNQSITNDIMKPIKINPNRKAYSKLAITNK